MKKINTKQQILDEALELFSKYGYEATSMNDIADAVGIRKASLYAHFNSKEEILNTIIDEAEIQYEKNSLFSKKELNKLDICKSPVKLTNEIIKQIKFIIHDNDVSRIRKLFMIEQFKNKKMNKFQQMYSYDNVMNYGIILIKYLVKNDILKDMNVEIMAAQVCLPISMWIYECDRCPKKEKEVMGLIKKHISQFFMIYKR